MILVCGVLLTSLVVSPISSGGATSGVTLQVWLGGTLTSATPGSAYLKWVNYVKSKFEAEHKGDTVDFTLLPFNNDELAAKVDAAFTAHDVPDLMFLYSGAYTTVYEQGLLHLNHFVDSTAGFYKSLSSWNLSCTNLNCKNGSGTIVGVPADVAAYFLFYNKKLFAEAGLKGPPATWSGLLSDCTTMKAKGIVPMAYGDQEGYDTTNFLDENLASYITQSQMNSVLDGKSKMTSSSFVKALKSVEQLRTSGCVPSNASTLGQLKGINQFAAGKAAMIEMVPAAMGLFETGGVGSKNLGVSLIPGTGPLGTHVASNSDDDWVIPAQAKHSTLAWDFIKAAMSKSAAALFVKDVGYPPTLKAEAQHFTDPVLRYMATEIAKPGNLQEFDSVLPNGVALYMYKDMNLFFAGQMSAKEVMSNTQAQLTQYLANSG